MKIVFHGIFTNHFVSHDASVKVLDLFAGDTVVHEADTFDLVRPEDAAEHGVDDNVHFRDSDSILDVDGLEGFELFLRRQLFGFW